mmetsp:Transcript_10341/g.22811  ORF Transcript_10341/g.22811 Transcript_10341/m.22811 type:complete len:201 (+) Transcript_10341:1002-1604(+)
MTVPQINVVQGLPVHHLFSRRSWTLRKATVVNKYRDVASVHLLVPCVVFQQGCKHSKMKTLWIGMLSCQPGVGDREQLRCLSPLVPHVEHQVLCRPNGFRRKVLSSGQHIATTVYLLQPITTNEDDILVRKHLPDGLPFRVVGVPRIRCGNSFSHRYGRHIVARVVDTHGESRVFVGAAPFHELHHLCRHLVKRFHHLSG